MKIIIYILSIISLIACNTTPSNSFFLEGSVENVEDDENILLYYFSLKNNEWYEQCDTAKIINGNFLFKGNIDELTAAELCFEEPDNVVISSRLFLEPTTMKLRINKNQPYAYELSGTKIEKENIELRKELEPDEIIFYKNLFYIDEILKQLSFHYNNATAMDSLSNLFRQLLTEQAAINNRKNRTRLDFILRHNTYQIVPDLLLSLAKSDSIPIDTIRQIYNNLPEQTKTSLMGKLALTQIEFQENKKKSFVGCQAPDFTRKDTSGRIITLSEFKNKNFILLDFWGSWCAPCIEAMVGDNPKVKNLYDKYNENGLVIIGISLDEDVDRWRNTINRYKLDQWPQILSFIQNENKSAFNYEDLSVLYNIKKVPYYVFINKEGNIVARWESLDEEQLIELDRFCNNIR